jgi:hypothetical protein
MSGTKIKVEQQSEDNYRYQVLTSDGQVLNEGYADSYTEAVRKAESITQLNG